MATRILKDGIRFWGGGIDAEGHRYYKLKIQTQGDAVGDGPATHMQTPGLPVAGSIWLYENRPDPWAWCDGSDDCQPRQGEGQRDQIYDQTFTFSTRPRGQRKGFGGGGKPSDDRGAAKKCSDTQIQDPLSEPPRTSGGSVRHQEEVQIDRFGAPIRNTAFEPIKGASVMFDRSRGTVTFEQNVVNLQYSTCMGMVDTVSDGPMWELDKRFWKLSEFHWERRLYATCFFYYTRRFVFESAVRKNKLGVLLPGWDREVLDESSKVLNGQWTELAGGGLKYVKKNFRDGTVPDFANPLHYIPIPPPPGGTTSMRLVLSKANRGLPAENDDDARTITVEHYQESNFFLLGIPTFL